MTAMKRLHSTPCQRWVDECLGGTFILETFNWGSCGGPQQLIESHSSLWLFTMSAVHTLSSATIEGSPACLAVKLAAGASEQQVLFSFSFMYQAVQKKTWGENTPTALLIPWLPVTLIIYQRRFNNPQQSSAVLAMHLHYCSQLHLSIQHKTTTQRRMKEHY